MGETMGSSTAYDRHIVVADEHLGMVLDLLGRGATKEDTDARLGLTLVELDDVHAAGQRLERAREDEPDARDPGDISGLDRVLANVRAITEARYAGWSPTMGKNRILTGVQFKPYTNAGGFTKPTRPDTVPDEFPAAPRSARRVRVGILDTRLEPHSRLAGRFLTDPDALARPESGAQRMWWEGHATFIAGIVLGLAPMADLDVRTALSPGAEPTDGWTMPLWTLAQ